MATLTITVNDAHVDRLLTAICGNHGYDGPTDNPSRSAFVREKIIDWARAQVRAWEAQQVDPSGVEMTP